MSHWRQIDEDELPGGATLTLYARDGEHMIRADGLELMTTAASSSERFLVDEAIAFFAPKPIRSILIGGLGLGFTLAQACDALPLDCRIVVVEISAKVITWVREYLSDPTGACLKDPRVEVVQADFIEYLASGSENFDVILADIDNGPVAMVHPGNDRLYHDKGLKAVRRRLSPGGAALFWSGIDDDGFLKTLGHHFNHVEKNSFPLPQARRISHTLYLASR